LARSIWGKGVFLGCFLLAQVIGAQALGALTFEFAAAPEVGAYCMKVLHVGH